MSVTVNIDLEEFYDHMDSWDKNEMLDLLKEDGYLDKDITGVNQGIYVSIPSDASFGQEEHLKLVSKLGGLYFRISNEDMEIIKAILKKY